MTDKSRNENADERSGKKPEADAKGQSERRHKGRRNDGVASARVLSRQVDRSGVPNQISRTALSRALRHQLKAYP